MPSSLSSSLAGKRILLTGGTTGIGRATLALLVNRGARVLTFGRDERHLADALRSVETGPGQAIGLAADIGTREGLEAVFEAVDAGLGGLDILVACAALGADPIDEMAEEDWRYVVDTNLVGYMACARAALMRFEGQDHGHLVFVGSISAEMKAVGESVYSATKAGVQAFAETLRKEVADRGIRVGVVQPGSVDTDMQECSEDEKREAVASRQMLQAEEVAEAILFVLTRSPSANVINLRIEPLLQKTG